MKFILFIKRTLNMKKSYFIYSESELKRKDNTLQIKTVDGVKKIFLLKRYLIYML